MTPLAEVTAFAPATVANLGPGFDVLGLALTGPGDTVTARRVAGGGVRLVSVDGDGGRLPRDGSNTATIAAEGTLRRAGIDAGVELSLVKGLPLGSGLGSSAASAAAAACAVNVLVGSPLRKVDLVAACVDAEAVVSGKHADNAAAAVLGGLILVRSVEPLDLIRLPVPDGLTIVVATPKLELSTRAARAVLPESIPLRALVANAANIAAFVAACHSGDLGLLARSAHDAVVTPARARLIPGCEQVFSAALDAGALGVSFSGAGPSVFAWCRSERSGAEVGAAMVAAFALVGLPAEPLVCPADGPGARRL